MYAPSSISLFLLLASAPYSCFLLLFFTTAAYSCFLILLPFLPFNPSSYSCSLLLLFIPISYFLHLHLVPVNFIIIPVPVLFKKQIFSKWCGKNFAKIQNLVTKFKFRENKISQNLAKFREKIKNLFNSYKDRKKNDMFIY